MFRILPVLSHFLWNLTDDLLHLSIILVQDFVHWKLKLLNFLMDSILITFKLTPNQTKFVSDNNSNSPQMQLLKGYQIFLAMGFAALVSHGEAEPV